MILQTIPERDLIDGFIQLAKVKSKLKLKSTIFSAIISVKMIVD